MTEFSPTEAAPTAPPAETQQEEVTPSWSMRGRPTRGPTTTPAEMSEFPCGWCNGTDEHRADCPSWTPEPPAETQQDNDECDTPDEHAQAVAHAAGDPRWATAAGPTEAETLARFDAAPDAPESIRERVAAIVANETWRRPMGAPDVSPQPADYRVADAVLVVLKGAL